ncbi:amino acid transporter [Microbacterium sp. CFBP 8794]|uniref:amino acid transporter n=1 Tax=Microbacterium sp. CFBP 8794 TaxID=2775269 RepID=UPI0020178EC4|nr:amino acid transporter [Microbacterium sp. CFBP 8794]
MTDKPTRRDLMKPVQLLGLAFVAALFAGFVTLMSMGFFQTRPAEEIQRALVVAAVAAGATFIVTLVSVALMLLMVDPSKVTATIDRPLLLPTDDQDAAPTGAAAAPAAPNPAATTDPTDAKRPTRSAADGPDGDTAAPKA